MTLPFSIITCVIVMKNLSSRASEARRGIRIPFVQEDGFFGFAACGGYAQNDIQ